MQRTSDTTSEKFDVNIEEKRQQKNLKLGLIKDLKQLYTRNIILGMLYQNSINRNAV